MTKTFRRSLSHVCYLALLFSACGCMKMASKSLAGSDGAVKMECSGSGSDQFCFKNVDGLAVVGDVIQGKADAFRSRVAQSSHSRAFINTNPTLYWPDGIVPYVVSSSVAAQAIPAIVAINTLTRAKLVAWRGERNYVTFLPSRSGDTMSFVGMVGMAQPIFIASWADASDALHEIGHALGLNHEDQRPDRDLYVWINWGAINPAYYSQFQIIPSGAAAYGAYDYASIMHYPSYSGDTIDPNQPELLATNGAVIPRNAALSFGDIAAINHIVSLASPGPGPTPGPPLLQPATYDFAIEANTDVLWTVDNNGNGSNTSLGMKPGTIPGIATLSNGGYALAFQANTGDLWTGAGTTNLGMDNASSPSIAGLTGGGFVIAFQANTGKLWTVDDKGRATDTDLGMMAETNPSIAGLADGSYVTAFQANTGHLWIVDKNGPKDADLGMMAGTSPSIAGLFGGGYVTAFQANTGHLWIVDNHGPRDANLGMMAGTSPSIAGLADGGYVTTFQANTGHLWIVDNQGPRDTNLGMLAGASPRVVGLASGGYTVGFEANTGHFWLLFNNGAKDTNLGMYVPQAPAAIATPTPTSSPKPAPTSSQTWSPTPTPTEPTMPITQLSLVGLDLMFVGTNNGFESDASYSDGSSANVSSKATWTSSNPAVAYVVPNASQTIALVKAVGVGTATITASYRGKSATQVLTVEAAPTPTPTSTSAPNPAATATPTPAPTAPPTSTPTPLATPPCSLSGSGPWNTSDVTVEVQSAGYITLDSTVTAASFFSGPSTALLRLYVWGDNGPVADYYLPISLFNFPHTFALDKNLSPGNFHLTITPVGAGGQTLCNGLAAQFSYASP